MEPVLLSGAKVEVRPQRLYLPGDLLAFVRGEQLYVHRFLGYVWWRRWLLLTRADHSQQRDAPIEPGAVLGRICGGEASAAAIRPPVGVRWRALRHWLQACVEAIRKGER